MQASILQRRSWKNLFAYMGPGFLVSIAYIDPGNCKITLFLIFFFSNEGKTNSETVYLWYSYNNLQLRRIFRLGHNINMRCIDTFLVIFNPTSSVFHFCLFFLQLLWIILVASCAALVIQSMAANLGVVTGT